MTPTGGLSRGTPTPPRFLRTVPPDSVAAALAEALAGGDPIAPLPEDGTERRITQDMLQLELPVEEDDAVAVVATSGSTGQPKGVVLSRAAITAAATATHTRLGGPGDWVLAMPAHYVAGLMVLARCAVAATTATRVPTDLTGLAAAVAAGRSRRRYLSLVPTQLVRACADESLSETLATFDVVLLGGAAADPRLLERARTLGITVVTTYGMSETCGGCVYDGVPLDGVSVDLQPGTSRITLGGPSLFSGYRLRPDLTAAAMQGTRLLTQDRGRWEQGRLEVLGRVDDVVVSGGLNVDLAAVERAARTWPGLSGAEIVVVGVPDPEWGTEVVGVTEGVGPVGIGSAGIAPAGVGSVSELRSYLCQTLPAAAAPRRLAGVARLPRTSSGKIDRQRLIADLVADRTRREGSSR